MTDIYKKEKKNYGKILFWVLLIVFLVSSFFIWYKFYFVFGEGVKSGYLNYAVRKGYVFKTYEGKLIQEGFGGGGNKGLIRSYEFEFSIDDSKVFEQLQNNSGKHFDLHYKEYKGALPWRGNTRYVVDRIVNMK